MRRPTAAYEGNELKTFPTKWRKRWENFSPQVSTSTKAHEDVPHFYSLIPLAQAVAAPIFDLKGAGGLVGAQFKQADDASTPITVSLTACPRDLHLD